MHYTCVMDPANSVSDPFAFGELCIGVNYYYVAQHVLHVLNLRNSFVTACSETDRQTDGQTDGQTDTRACSCIRTARAAAHASMPGSSARGDRLRAAERARLPA